MDLDRISLPLFLPADRLDRLEKALGAGADAVILDLEDGVGAEGKSAARDALAGRVPETPPVPVILRINGADTAWFADDLAAAARLPLAAVMLPKAETAKACEHVAGTAGKPVVGLIESGRGVRAADEVAAACARLAFGSIDYAADVGCGHEREALLMARSALVLAARLAGRPAPIDGVTTAIGDEDALLGDCRHAVTMGFAGKLIIHPAQIEPARRGFAPSADEVDWARRILAAIGSNTGAVKVDGAMVDAPVIKRARQILARAGETA
ncbi:CoA ester lyase [Acuticoccus sp. MNP-M23]|uniref:HpcH/HpaI aldolase/citrate lyase family protein n=1 Tax=Acuticoccus sp. MNP-M23 TaxID=3072793 RepID=UPI0028159A2C|nr:CoA ester lyase [Acuticoccus sp. MNP-M23]WMS43783.1 CoA ester lyase [Acuticoccus sp. MNP-M23]